MKNPSKFLPSPQKLMRSSAPLAFVSALILSFTSCEKEIPYKGDDEDPLLVVNAICKNDSLVRIDLERSVFFLANDANTSKLITSGATLKLTDLNTGIVYTQTVPVSGSTYEFPLTALPNNSYSIEVSHPDYPAVNATMKSTPKIELTAVDTSSFYNTDGQLTKKAVMKWNDPAGENYYMIKLFVTDPNGNYTYYNSFTTNDPSVEQDNSAGGQNYFDLLYFSDELFEGKAKEFEINFSTYFPQNPADNPIYTYHLISMNKETYQYLVSVDKNGQTDFFTEPVKVFNNINGGYGIFGSINHSLIVH